MKEKKSKRAFYAGILGAADPVLRNWAQQLAARVPDDSPIHQGWVEAIGGVTKGLAEVYGTKLPDPFAIGIEKITDFFDFFSGALRPGASGDTGGGKVSSWQNEFLKKAGERLASTVDIEGELGKLKAELQARLELEAMFKPKKPVSPKKDFGENLYKADGWLNKKLTPGLNWLESLPGAKGRKKKEKKGG